jgi:GDP-L-fucose synthase
VNKNARIFVAGHAGLIGSAIVRAFKRAGYVNLMTRTRAEVDLHDADCVTRFFREARPEHVILAAGRVGGIGENTAFPADFMDANLSIQLNVLRAAKATDVAKLILFGSSCMYPRECPQPMTEDALLTGKPEPTSLPYAMSKLAGTYMCLAYNDQYRAKRFIPVIPNSVYGPHDNFDPRSGHVLSALIARFHAAKCAKLPSVTLWGSGAPRREFVHADDVAAACIFLLEHDVTTLELPVNLGVGHDLSISELAQAIADVVGFDGALVWDRTKPDGAPRKLLDSSRLSSFGWTPTIDFAAGLKSTYDWYVRNAASQAVIN